MSTPAIRERECVHRHRGADGMFYEGSEYVASLQRLRADAAVRVAGRVAAFFWSDARQTVVWLCRDCADELRLSRGQKS